MNRKVYIVMRKGLDKKTNAKVGPKKIAVYSSAEAAWHQIRYCVMFDGKAHHMSFDDVKETYLEEMILENDKIKVKYWIDDDYILDEGY